MAKWVCSVCGYVHEGDTAPEVCPICKAPAEKFTKQDDEMAWAAEHVVGVAKGVSERGKAIPAEVLFRAVTSAKGSSRQVSI